MTTSDTVIVYYNLIKMLEYRNVIVKSPVLKPDEINQSINNLEYVLINGYRDDKDLRGPANVIVILISPNSKFATAAEFKKLIKILPENKEHLNLIFISKDIFKNNIKTFLLTLKNIYIEDYIYEIFMIELPKHIAVPKHSIATPEEVNYFCKLHYTNIERFPIILPTDPQAVWIGLKPGMVVKIDRISDTAGEAPVYRFCSRTIPRIVE